jgi:hypothetical protein
MNLNAAAIAADVSAPASPLATIPQIPHILILPVCEPVNVLILTEQKRARAISIKQCDRLAKGGKL